MTEIEPRLESSLLSAQHFDQNPPEIVRIQFDGRIFWKGREVETDDDFRAAMMDLARTLVVPISPRAPETP